MQEPMLSTGHSERDRWLMNVAFLLAGGSTLLLFAMLLDFPTRTPRDATVLIYRAILVASAVSLILIAWVRLFAGFFTIYRHAFLAPHRNRDLTVCAAGVLGFGISLAAIEVQLPFSQSWTPSVLLLLVPFVPLVFAPVALSHAFVFFAHAYPAKNRRLQAAQAGAVLLALVSVLAVLSQVFFYFGTYGAFEIAWWTYLPFPAGSTAFGYWLEFSVWEKPDRTLTHRTLTP